MTGMQRIKSQATAIPVLLGISEEGPIHLAGLREPIDGLPHQVIPSLWDRFLPYQGWLPGQKDKASYGALFKRGDQGFDYLTAVEVTDFQRINADWDCFDIPRQRYAVFPHQGHVSELRQTLHRVFAHSLPALHLTPNRRGADSPLLLERYAESFDPRTGWGDIQVWVPLERADTTTVTGTL